MSSQEAHSLVSPVPLPSQAVLRYVPAAQLLLVLAQAVHVPFLVALPSFRYWPPWQMGWSSHLLASLVPLPSQPASWRYLPSPQVVEQAVHV